MYTQWLNDRGGIVADVTVTRLDETQFMVATSGATLYHDLDWLRRHIPADARAVAVDVSNASRSWASWAPGPGSSSRR